MISCPFITFSAVALLPLTTSYYLFFIFHKNIRLLPFPTTLKPDIIYYLLLLKCDKFDYCLPLFGNHFLH